MAKEYIEQRDGGYYVAGTRVSLDSVVYAFLRGDPPEGIVDSFPALDLEQVLGALAYYLANRECIDRYLATGDKEHEALRQRFRLEHPALHAKLRDAKDRMHVSGR